MEGPQKGRRRRTTPVHTGVDAALGNQGFPHGIGGADDVIAAPLRCSPSGTDWSDGDLVTGIEHMAPQVAACCWTALAEGRATGDGDGDGDGDKGSRLEEVLASTDRATGRTQDPQDGAHQNKDATYRRQQPHANKQADDQQNQSKDDHFDTSSSVPAQARVRMSSRS
jgi:hypothetical protein